MTHKRTAHDGLICRIEMSGFAGVIIVLAFAVMLSLPSWPTAGRNALPRVRFAAEMPRATREDASRVAIIRDGKIFFGDQSIENNRLAEKIRRAWGTGAERRVYLRVDAQSRYSSVKEVLDAVRAAGVQDVSFRVEQKKPFGL